MKKILILSANPQNTSKLRLDEEVREIQAGLERAKRRSQFEIITRWAVRVDDLRRALLDHEPQIVHFSGHGTGSDGLALENNSGELQLVSTKSLARLFKFFKDKIECVLLNACYSEEQALAHQDIDCVIGMSQAVGDRAAIKFAIGFYDAIGVGRNYEDAFEFGCTSIDLEGIPESGTPGLKSRNTNQDTLASTTSNQRIFISYKRNVEPEDFTPEQVAQLNRRHNLPFDANSLQQLFRLLGGHPYLVRKALYLVACGQITPTELFTNATAASRPFGDHLRRLLSLLYDKLELIQGLQLVISQNVCPNMQIFWRLRGAGLVRASGQSALPRCQLYAEYFWENLHG